jgi:hypothetical protein
MGGHQDKQEDKVQPQAKGLAQAEAETEVMMENVDQS